MTIEQRQRVNELKGRIEAGQNSLDRALSAVLQAETESDDGRVELLITEAEAELG